MSWSVLVVDDEPMARDLLRLMLERAGLRVTEAEDGADALARVEQNLPDIIILDVMMPGIDGISVCRKLKEAERTAHIPVIMLSAKTHSSSIQEGLAAGATKYLSKLISRKDLIQNIHEILDSDSSANSQM